MRTKVISLVAASSIFLCGPIYGQDYKKRSIWKLERAFDVPVGEVQILQSGELSRQIAISCRFMIEDFRTAQDIHASVAIIFTSAAPDDYDVDAHAARLAAYRYEKDDGWRYEFTLTTPDDKNSRMVAYTGTSDHILPMWLLKAGYPTVIYVAGDDEIDVSTVDVSGRPLKSWQIVAIGVSVIPHRSRGQSTSVSP